MKGDIRQYETVARQAFDAAYLIALEAAQHHQRNPNPATAKAMNAAYDAMLVPLSQYYAVAELRTGRISLPPVLHRRLNRLNGLTGRRPDMRFSRIMTDAFREALATLSSYMRSRP